MKKVLLYILLPLVAMGCSLSDEISTEEQQGDAMSFNFALPEAATRSATMINSAEELLDSGESVGLYAFNQDKQEAIAENVKLVYDSATGLWGTEAGITWGFDYPYEKFSFYVYYPYRDSADGINFNMTYDTFSIDYNASTYADDDVMIGQLRDVVCPNDGVVSLTLNHILSAVTISTTYKDNMKDIELIAKSCYTSGTASLNASTDVVAWDFTESESSAGSWSLEYSEDSQDNHLFIIPQTTAELGDLYFSISYIDGSDADTGAQIPALMTFKAGVTYTFEYTSSYFDYEKQEDGTVKLYIDLDDFDYDLTDTDAVDEQISFLVNYFTVELGYDIDEITISIKGTYVTWDLFYHIVTSELFEFVHIDLSEFEIGTDTTFKYEAFLNNTNIKSVIMPATFNDTNFDTHQFSGCSSLESVTFLDTVTITEIPTQAFQNCTSLTSINIPATVVTIGYNTFQGCTSLCGSTNASEGTTGIYFEDGRTATLTIYQSAFASTYVYASDMPTDYNSASGDTYTFSTPQ